MIQATIKATASAVLYAFPGLAALGRSFGEALLRMATRHGWDPNAIAAVMCRESGFNPAARNPATDASGLIQFMPATAQGLGTNTRTLRTMTAERQLEYVERYFRNAFGSWVPERVGTYYMATFYPAMMRKAQDQVIFQRGSVGYQQNEGLDRDGNGRIEVGDVELLVEQTYLAAQAKGTVEWVEGTGTKPFRPNPGPTPGTGGSGVDMAAVKAELGALREAQDALVGRVDLMIARVEAGIVRAIEIVDTQTQNTTTLDQLASRVTELEQQHKPKRKTRQPETNGNGASDPCDPTQDPVEQPSSPA